MAAGDSTGARGKRRVRAPRDRKRWPHHGRPAQCDTCGQGFQSQYTGKTAGNWTRFCSAPCYQLSRTVAADRLPRLVVTSHHGHCDGCGKHYRKATQAQRYCAAECRPCAYAWTPTMRPCLTCGREFEAGKWQQTCSEECGAEVDRKARRVAKSRRRARIRGAEHESIDPLKVFARDGWRCQLCGVATPKRLRGTYEDAAPELDHIVALATGGTHTWANVQCACRKCNGGKGVKAMGQLNLPMAA